MTTPATPQFGVTTMRLYERLPEYIRLADARQTMPNGLSHPLLRFISSVVDTASEVERTIQRLDYDLDGGNTTSDLVDPRTADARWLPWLGQLVGARITPNLSEAEARDAVLYASAGFRAGTKQAVADAAKTELTGAKAARVYDHSTDTAGGLGTATQWDVLIVTRPSETPSIAAVIAAVERRNAKPAGVVLHYATYEASWAAIHANLPTWGHWRGKTWRTIQEVGI